MLSKIVFRMKSSFKFIALAAAAVAFLFVGTASAKDGIKKHEIVAPYTVTEIAKNVYRIEDCTPDNPEGQQKDSSGKITGENNCSDMYLVIGKDEAMLIDLSNKQKDMNEAMYSLRTIVSRRIGTRRLTIAITHNHGDHTGMLSAFSDNPNVNFWVPEADFGHRAPAGKFGKPDFPSDRTVFFPDTASLDLGNGYVIFEKHFAGHTNGSTAFFLKKLKMAFTGDTFGSGAGVWIFDSEGFDQYSKSIDEMVKFLKDNRYEKIDIRSGHYWQKDQRVLKSLDKQYIIDMQTLVHQINSGIAKCSPMPQKFGDLDMIFEYGTAQVTWSSKGCIEYFKEVKKPFVGSRYIECLQHPGEKVGFGPTHKDQNLDVVKLYDTYTYDTKDLRIGRMDYYLYDPTKHGMPAGRKYPLIVVFHGANNGRDGIYCTTDTDCAVYAGPEYQKMLGGAYVLFPRANEKDTVLSGRKMTYGTWMTVDSLTKTSMYVPYAAAIIEKVIAENHIDPQHVCVGGTSAGGFMTWRFLAARPDIAKIAFLMAPANAPSSSELDLYEKMSLPIWVVHGLNDEICKYPNFTGKVADRLKSMPRVRLSELDTVRYGDKSVVRMDVGGTEMGQHLAEYAIGSNMLYDDGTPYDPNYPAGFIAWLKSECFDR